MRRTVPRHDRLLVIGAGAVGLGMADAMRQRGIAFDQVEADEGVGGNWRHGVYQGVHIVSSKHSTAYADYPMPAH
ncbi:MAG: NAD(P)-binding protein, partial [Hyphomicrobium sp.]